MTRTYHSYKFDNSIESYMQNKIDLENSDRCYMAQQIKPSVDYLYRHGIRYNQDFAKLFKKYKFKSKEITNFVQNFQLFINTRTNKPKIFWLRKRELTKANFGEKNIIINRLVHEYNDIVHVFLIHHFCYNFPNTQNLNLFIQDFESKVKEVVKQSEQKQNDNSSNNSNSSENENIEIVGERIISETNIVKKIIILK